MYFNKFVVVCFVMFWQQQAEREREREREREEGAHTYIHTHTIHSAVVAGVHDSHESLSSTTNPKPKG